MHHHAALIERIRTDDRPVTLLVAPAGFGKTVFAGQLARAVDATRTGAGVFDGPGWRILDIGPDGMPPDGLSLEGPGRLVILCRPGAEPRGLSRARLYDRVQELGAPRRRNAFSARKRTLTKNVFRDGQLEHPSFNVTNHCTGKHKKRAEKRNLGWSGGSTLGA